MDQMIQYLISFLLGEKCAHLSNCISYGDSKIAGIIIQPSRFFEEGIFMTEKSLPQLPLPELEGVPVLFGKPEIHGENGKVYIEADLVASAFYLLSRYEECVRRDIRDEHGRFPGTESLPYRAGFLSRPIVDEYGRILRDCLRRLGMNAPEPTDGFSHVYLTHDVDEIWTWNNLYRALRSTVKRILTHQKDAFLPIKAWKNYEQYDPVYTFPWILEQDEEARTALGDERCTPVYFLMGAVPNLPYDRGYIQNTERTSRLIDRLKAHNSVLGYHLSYAASQNAACISEEIRRIEALTGTKVHWNRNHYLASREPEAFRDLIDAGITDDFTMAYANVSGFRLGTSRPVHWIDPIRRQVTELILHPMTVMECTLDVYMGIKDEEEAFTFVKDLLKQVWKHGGEAVLLWHSPEVYPTPGSYHRSLYCRVLKEIESWGKRI